VTGAVAGAIVLGLLVASNVMIGTGLTFHQISVLGEWGFDPTQAAAVFVPIAVVGIAATFAIGWLVDRVPARAVVVLSPPRRWGLG
jgi:hypothetical protein